MVIVLEMVLALTNNSHKWRDWSLENGSTNLKHKMRGTKSSRGTVYELDSNKQVGSGCM